MFFVEYGHPWKLFELLPFIILGLLGVRAVNCTLFLQHFDETE